MLSHRTCLFTRLKLKPFSVFGVNVKVDWSHGRQRGDNASHFYLITLLIQDLTLERSEIKQHWESLTSNIPDKPHSKMLQQGLTLEHNANLLGIHLDLLK